MVVMIVLSHTSLIIFQKKTLKIIASSLPYYLIAKVHNSNVNSYISGFAYSLYCKYTNY